VVAQIIGGNMRHADNQVVKKLNKLFPVITYNDIEEAYLNSKLYPNFIISIFDHCLTEKEAEDQIISYSFKGALNRQKYFKKEKIYLKFFEQLFTITLVLKVVEEDDSSVSYFYYDNIDEFIKDCRSSLTELELFKLCLPDFEAIIVGNYDLDNIVYYKNNKRITKLKKLVFGVGLFIR
jgi:hypothetical protein